MELHPLGFGEIFDRAITLYIRNFVWFAAIVAVMIVPLAIVQYVYDLASQPQWAAIFWIFQHPGAKSVPHIPTFFDSPALTVTFLIIILFSITIAPFVTNAVAVGVARLYRGRPVEFRACYETVLHRWAQILGVIGVEILAIIGLYIAVAIVTVIVVLGVSALAAASPQVAFAIGAISLIVAFIGILVFLAPLFVALTFAMYSAVIEERGVTESLALGFSRIFNRVEFWRALLFAIASAAVVFGASTMFSMIGLVAAFLHMPLLETILQALPSALISPFSVVLLAVYYFDVRIRREGLDLETSLERLTAAQPA